MTPLPNTDSISELAAFWDEHDLIEFEDELEEVHEAVFVRPENLVVHLSAEDAKALQALAVKRREPRRNWYQAGSTSA